MATLMKNIEQSIQDFNNIKQAIIKSGVEVPDGTKTSEYANLIKKDAVSKTPPIENYTVFCDADDFQIDNSNFLINRGDKNINISLNNATWDESTSSIFLPKGLGYLEANLIENEAQIAGDYSIFGFAKMTNVSEGQSTWGFTLCGTGSNDRIYMGISSAYSSGILYGAPHFGLPQCNSSKEVLFDIKNSNKFFLWGIHCANKKIYCYINGLLIASFDNSVNINHCYLMLNGGKYKNDSAPNLNYTSDIYFKGLLYYNHSISYEDFLKITNWMLNKYRMED